MRRQTLAHNLNIQMAAFRYPHRTRPNSGPDQIILVLKISTEPVRSWCCLHIHAKFWSAAAVANTGTHISFIAYESAVFTNCMCELKHDVFTVSFYFPLLLDNKTAKTGTLQIQVLQERRRHVLRYFSKRCKDFYEKQRSRRARFTIFLQMLAININSKFS